MESHLESTERLWDEVCRGVDRPNGRVSWEGVEAMKEGQRHGRKRETQREGVRDAERQEENKIGGPSPGEGGTEQ